MLRAIFLICLIIVTLRVALPQSETIWTIYDEPGDVVRFSLGIGVCIWIAVHLFKWPTESQAYQTWFNFGLAGVPFGVLCAVFLWWNHLHTWWHLLHGCQDFCARRAFVCSTCKPVLSDDLTCLRRCEASCVSFIGRVGCISDYRLRDPFAGS